MFRSPFSNTLPIAAKYQGQGSDRWYARVNQRFLPFALADESPPEERAKRVFILRIYTKIDFSYITSLIYTKMNDIPIAAI